jgi:hypothetical protein
VPLLLALALGRQSELVLALALALALALVYMSRNYGPRFAHYFQNGLEPAPN